MGIDLVLQLKASIEVNQLKLAVNSLNRLIFVAKPGDDTLTEMIAERDRLQQRVTWLTENYGKRKVQVS